MPRNDIINKKFFLPFTIHNSPSAGFTLAEILIVVGIIGVVAALTIPTIQAKIEVHQHAVALKKIYSELSQAVEKIQTPEYWQDIPTVANASGVRTVLGTVMDYVKTDTALNIWGEVGPHNSNSTYRNYKGTSPAYMHIYNARPAAILKDGSFIAFTSSYRESSDFHEIYVDTNGKKPPNMVGMDTHVFILLYQNNYYRLIPMGAKDADFWSSSCAAGATDYKKSWACTYLMLKNPDAMP